MPNLSPSLDIDLPLQLVRDFVYVTILSKTLPHSTSRSAAWSAILLSPPVHSSVLPTASDVHVRHLCIPVPLARKDWERTGSRKASRACTLYMVVRRGGNGREGFQLLQLCRSMSGARSMNESAGKTLLPSQKSNFMPRKCLLRRPIDNHPLPRFDLLAVLDSVFDHPLSVMTLSLGLYARHVNKSFEMMNKSSFTNRLQSRVYVACREIRCLSYSLSLLPPKQK